MTIIGKTYFTYLKSRKNKISSRNCNFFFFFFFFFLVRLVRCKQASPPPVPDCRGRDFKQKPGGVKAAQTASSLSDRRHVVREPGGLTVHTPPPPPPPGTFHYGSKMYLRVSRTQSHLFPGQLLGCTGVIALCAMLPSCLQSVAG